jgi:hypothetical protein
MADSPSSQNSNLETGQSKPTNSSQQAPTTNNTVPLPKDFETSSVVYPSDLLSSDSRYGGNYVMFNISVHQDSYLMKNGKEPTVASSAAVTRTNYTEQYDQKAIGAASGTTAFFGGAGVSSMISSLDKKRALHVTSLLSVGAGVVTASIAGAKYKTLQKAICLYMPNSLDVKYGIEWGETNLNPMVMLALGLSKLSGFDTVINNNIEMANNLWNGDNIAKGTVEVDPNVAGLKTMMQNLVLKVPGSGDMTSISSGRAANPMAEQIFKDVNFRSFSFSYKFFPKNQNELNTVLDIIKTFKFHMHPEYPDPSAYVYIYPSIFDIKYYHNGEENTALFKHTTAALDNMTVNYTPQDSYTSFANGAPSQISIELSFRELVTLTKSDIESGF